MKARVPLPTESPTTRRLPQPMAPDRPYWEPKQFPPAAEPAYDSPRPTLRRRWRVFLLPHSHTDIGFTHPQPECLERHAANLDAALLFIEETRDWPFGSQFKWNIEAALQLEHYERTRPPRQRDRLIQACRAGSIGIEALWGNVLTGLCHTEELCRLTYTAVQWGQRYGVPVDTAMLSDVAGYVWNLPQVLARSGVRFLSCALNNHRAPLFTLGALPPLFYWEGPDGSRLLTAVTDTYSYARLFGFAPVSPDGARNTPRSTEEAVERVAHKLFHLLGHLEATGYPYDVVLLRGSLGDNSLADLQLAMTVRAFNARYANPTIQLALSREFADLAEEAIRRGRWPSPPVLRGDFTGYWEDGAGSSAAETALGRASQRLLVAAEARHALALLRDPAYRYPVALLREALRFLWLYDEHTWGASVSVSEPDSLRTRWQWRFKSDYAYTAADLARCVAERCPPPASGQVASGQATSGQARAAPSLSGAHRSCSWDGRIAENHRFRVEFDPDGGDVLLVYDKRLGRELLKSARPSGPAAASTCLPPGAAPDLRVNHYLYERTEPFAKLAQLPLSRPGWLGWLAGHLPFTELPPKRATQEPAAPAVPRLGAADGDVLEVVVERQAPGCRRLTQRVRLCGDLGVEFVNELDKLDVREKEAVYFTFPCAVERPTFRLEVGGVPLRPEEEQLPGACRDWYAVQRYVAVTNDVLTVLWSPVEAPLVCLTGLTPELWQAHHPQPWANGTLVSWALNNYWNVNYKASQGGRLVFRYRLGAHEGPFDAARAVQWLARWPHAGEAQLLDAGSAAKAAAPGTKADAIAAAVAPANLLPDVSASLAGALAQAGETGVAVEPATVELIALKRAERSDGIVARLVELSGRATRARLHLPVPVAAARRATLVEEPGEALETTDGAIMLDLGPHEIATIMLWPRPPAPKNSEHGKG